MLLLLLIIFLNCVFADTHNKMSEYWLISAPGDKTCQQTWETMNNVTSKQNNLCVNFKFHIPDLKVSFFF